MRPMLRRLRVPVVGALLLAGCRVSPPAAVSGPPAATRIAAAPTAAAVPRRPLSPALTPSAAGEAPPSRTRPGTATAAAVTATASPTSESSPYPYTTPLPPPIRTVLDGRYAKLDPKEATPVPCRRCADWKPEGGEWTLWLDKGIFRVFHKPTAWRTVGSFTVSENRLLLFNDPTCHLEVGTYIWRLDGPALILEAVEDNCAIGLRAKNLTALRWLACQPPSTEAAVTDHWPRPPGC